MGCVRETLKGRNSSVSENLKCLLHEKDNSKITHSDPGSLG